MSKSAHPHPPEAAAEASLALLELDPAKLIQLKIGQFLAFETLISKVSYENGS